MPPKDRKSLAQWMLCEKCGCTVSNKDVMRHSESSCPPCFENLAHGLIKDKSLHSFVEEQKSNSTNLKHIPSSEHSSVVQLSQQAMQLCRFAIGDPVTVELSGQLAVCTAWPTPEGSLMSVMFNREGLELLNCKPGSQVKVSNLVTPPLPARDVTIIQEGSTDLLPSDDVSTLLRGQHQGRVFFPHNVLLLKHLGTTLRFRVVKVIPYSAASTDGSLQDPEQFLVDNMKMLGISESEQSFCLESQTVFHLQGGSEDKKQATDVSETLAGVGGLDEIIKDLQEMMQLALADSNPIPGLKASRGVLLYGAPGTGKSLLARALCKESGAAVFSVQGPEIFSKFYGETEAKLREIFEEATRRAPSVILLDEVDVLCQRRGGSGSQQEQRVVAALLAQLDMLQDARIMVIAATSRPDAIDGSMRRPGRLDREIELPVPGPQARKQILECMLSRIPHRLSVEQVGEVARTTHGFVGADLLALCAQASARAVKQARSVQVKTTPVLQSEHFEWALTLVKPSAMREILVEIPSVRWTDIGGQHNLKLKLQQAIEWPLKHPEAFTRLGIRPPRGVLMYGPPGCSKTMIARALATESGLNFLSIKGPELFSKWVGESERAVRAVFRRARQVAPSIVFFDELDALCGERGGAGGGSNVQERVLAQLLTELDGVQPLGNVTVVAATNRPDRIDKALLRPGRLDRIVHVPLPDAATRREIFSLQFRKTPTAVDVNIDYLVNNTNSYSGAEVTAVCHEAALAALQEDISAPQVELRHFELALTLVTPRTPDSLLELYAKYQQ